MDSLPQTERTQGVVNWGTTETKQYSSGNGEIKIWVFAAHICQRNLSKWWALWAHLLRRHSQATRDSPGEPHFNKPCTIGPSGESLMENSNSQISDLNSRNTENHGFVTASFRYAMAFLNMILHSQHGMKRVFKVVIFCRSGSSPESQQLTNTCGARQSG